MLGLDQNKSAHIDGVHKSSFYKVSEIFVEQGEVWMNKWIRNKGCNNKAGWL